MKCQKRERVCRSFLSSAAPCFSSVPLSCGKCLLRVFIHTECAKKYVHHRPRSLHPSVFLLKSPSFFVFDLSTRCLTYAQQSTIVTRNRNFVSMVLIKYPHQYREQERKRRGNGVRGTEEVENQRENERFFFCFRTCPVMCCSL